MRSAPRLLALAGALLWALGCGRPPPAPPEVDDTPPDGSAHYVDGDGVARTLLTPIGTLAYGDRVEDELPPPGALVGYEFAGSAGDAPALIVDILGQTRISLALYGPRDDEGLWGRPLGHVSGLDVLRLSDMPLPADGHYFILVRVLAGPPARFALQLDCPDCDAAVCADVEPCDLYCEQGYAIDDAACRACGCQENPCAGDDECLANEVCRDGVCRPAPSCQERCGGAPLEPVCDPAGRTWPNRCIAECEAAGELLPGRCAAAGCGPDDPCPDGQRCASGACVCDCPDALEPVCAESGRTFSNRCNLECAGEALAYEGPCNGPPLTTACEDDTACSRGQICARGLDGPGLCTLPCRPGDPRSCGDRAVCTQQSDGRGVCLPPCRADDRCQEASACLPDRRGARLCMPCDCPEGEAPVCADGRVEYPSRCAARCAGVDEARLTPGACEDAPAEIDCQRCPMQWEPVCADGVIRATLCDAECGDRPAREIGPVEACFREAPSFECREDADCELTGGGVVCAAEPVEGQPMIGPATRCFVGLGACGCVEGRCGFRPEARELGMCLDRSRGAFRPMR